MDRHHLDADAAGARLSGTRAPMAALVTMPFVSVRRPSLQLGLLKAIAERGGFAADTFHLNLPFARAVGPELYETLCQHRGRLIGDWIFSPAAFGAACPDPEGHLLERVAEELPRLLDGVEDPAGTLARIRSETVPAFLEAALDLADWGRYRVVGFTSTFQQNGASFALARLLKERHPHVAILFGGANFEGEMGVEYVRGLDFIDYAVTGEGDEAFPALLSALAEGRDPAGIPGVAFRRAGAVHATPPGPPLKDLDSLPVPSFDEYFERAESLGLLEPGARRLVDIPFESARGCWWGAKHHCTFCGLNGGGMAYRSKSPERVYDELAELTRRYRSFQFEAVDNILDTAYLKTLFVRLRERQADYQFFYEVKSNLSRADIRTLRDGGVRRIQPGIESLSTPILKLMRKGVTAAQNVNALRWSRHYGVSVGWNILWGFPGETRDDYDRQAETLAAIRHLEPPGGCGRIWVERFSPIFFDRASFPARSLRPEASYGHVYPATLDHERIAYFFECELEGVLPDGTFEATARLIDEWQKAWRAPERPSLTYWSAGDFLQVEDRRDPATPGTYTFEGDLATLYRACSDRPLPASALARMLPSEPPVEEVEEAMDGFCAHGLAMRDGNLFLSLALPASPER
jgi:ribosomal peptide maturation radical SAM protein 1